MTSDRRFLQSKTDLLRSRPLWRRHSLKKNCVATEAKLEKRDIVNVSDLFGNHSLELGDRNRWEFWTDKVIHLLRAWFVTCRVCRRSRCFLFLHNSRGQLGKKGLWQESHLPDHITASALLLREPRITWVHIHNTEIKWSEEDIIIQLEKFGNVTTSCHELVINDPDSPWQSNVCLDQWSQSENCWQPRSQSLTGPNTAAGGRPTSGEAH